MGGDVTAGPGSERAPTLYFAAVAAFLHGNPEEAVRLAERAVDR